VSPLPTKTLQLFFSPSTVLALSRRGWRGQLARTHSYAVPDDSGDESWQAALPTLALAVKEFDCAAVRVRLSHHFVQYRVLPWRAELRGDEEYMALAELEFSSAFGALAKDWTLALSDERPGASRVAAALPTELLLALGSTVASAGARLTSVQTYLSGAEALWQQRGSRKGSHWLVMHEPGRVCFGVRQNGNWRWLRHARVGADWVRQLPQLLASEAMLADLEPPTTAVQVFAPSADPEARQALQGQGFGLLAPVNGRGFMAQRDALFAPAWSAWC